MVKYLVLDIGGSAIKYALIDEENNFLNKGKIPAPRENIQQLIDAVYGLYLTFQDDIKGIAISMPGRIDSDRGFAFTGGVYTYMKNIELVKLLQEKIKLPITIHNDAKCAASAEVGFGNLQDVKDAAVIILGSGIGGCLVLDGKVHNGHTFASGEFSWIRTDGDSFDYKDCWVSKNGISGFLKIVQNACNSDEVMDGEGIFDKANHGDEKVLKGVDIFCRQIAIQIYSLQCIFDPQKIAIGGGISAQPLLLQFIRKHIDTMYELAKDENSPITKPNVVLCKYKNDANLLGAYYQHILKTKNKE